MLFLKSSEVIACSSWLGSALFWQFSIDNWYISFQLLNKSNIYSVQSCYSGSMKACLGDQSIDSSIAHSTTQYYTVLHSTAQYYTVLHGTTQYCTVLHSTTQYYTILHSTTRYYTVLHSTTQYYTVLHNTTQYYTVLHCTTRYYTVHSSKHTVLCKLVD